MLYNIAIRHKTAGRYNSIMTSENFERTLQAFQRRRPFRSFSVRFVSGEPIDVDHAEALVICAGVGVYVSAAGVPIPRGESKI